MTLEAALLNVSHSVAFQEISFDNCWEMTVETRHSSTSSLDMKSHQQSIIDNSSKNLLLILYTEASRMIEFRIKCS